MHTPSTEVPIVVTDTSSLPLVGAGGPPPAHAHARAAHPLPWKRVVRAVGLTA